MEPINQIKTNIKIVEYLQNSCQDRLFHSFEIFFDNFKKVNEQIDLTNFEQMFEDPNGGENGIQVMLEVKSIHQDISGAIFVELQNESNDCFYETIERFTFEEQKDILNYLIKNNGK